MKEINLKNISKVHCVGIGGIGVSAIARFFKSHGKTVTGSDIVLSDITKALEQEDIIIFEGQKIEDIPTDTDLVVYSVALVDYDPEFIKRLKELYTHSLTYPEALGLISKSYTTVAVAGTHGKTTTTAMIAEVLTNAGLSPNVIVGSLLKDTGSNYINGDGNLFVVEAGEYRRAFLNLEPKIAVILNIEEDHLDYYKDIKDIQSAFREFAEKVPRDGYIICNPKDSNVKTVIDKLSSQIIDFEKIDSQNITLKVPGEHNIQNAKATIAVSKILGVDVDTSTEYLKDFEGTWRRQEYVGVTEKGAIIYDDYAHHPTEVRETLKAFKAKYPKKNIIAVFQPHLYSRTKKLFNEFKDSFGDSNQVVVLPIYAAREHVDTSINSKMLTDAIKESGVNVQFIDNFLDTVKYLKENTDEKDLILTLGAGDIDKIASMLLNR